MNPRAFLAAALAWIILPSPAPACSLAAGYLIRSNFELVRDTQAIVLARTLRIEKGKDDHERIVLEVETILKGIVTDKTLALRGTSRWEGASDPTDFSVCRPGAGTGGCIPSDYRLDADFLLFLEWEDDRWGIRMSPFCRVNEEVAGPEAPWVRAVKEYLRIAALQTADDQKKGLLDLLTRNHAIPGLNKDIERHFRQPHGTKPYEDLAAMYDRSADDQERGNVLYAFAQGRHTNAAPLIHDLIGSGDWTTFVDPIAEFVSSLQDSAAVPALIERLSDTAVTPEARWAVLRAVAEAGDASVRQEVTALLKTVSDEETLPLTKYFLRHPDPGATAELARRQAGNRLENTQMTVALAAMGDPDTLAWALHPGELPVDRRWVSTYVLAISPLPEADRAAAEILGGTDHAVQEWLVQGYGQSRSEKRIQRLEEAFRLRPEDASLQRWVRQSLRELATGGDGAAGKALRELPRPADR